jgi:hypothetical protein
MGNEEEDLKKRNEELYEQLVEMVRLSEQWQNMVAKQQQSLERMERIIVDKNEIITRQQRIINGFKESS